MVTGHSDPRFSGVLTALLAYSAWGVYPVYFRQLEGLPAIDVVAWRIVLSCLLLTAGLALISGPLPLWRRLRSIGDWPHVLAATLLITVNWLVFVDAVQAGEILQASLGYFLVPVINSALGIWLFGERPNLMRSCAILVAFFGMLLTFMIGGVLPAHALLLAISFGLYGAVRKRSSTGSTTGLWLETLILAPFAAAFLAVHGVSLDTLDVTTRLWLLLAGLITVVPLLCMVFAARRIELGTLGFIQYITPVSHFVIAVGVYAERIDVTRAMAFVTTLLAVGLWLIGLRRPNGRSVPG